jgi:hypothetical protein
VADQRNITLYVGHASPTTVVLWPLAVATVPFTVVYLLAPQSPSTTVLLRDLTQAPQAGGAVVATLSATLEAVALASDADIVVTATMTASLDGAQLTSAAAVSITGGVGVELDAAVLTATAQVALHATLSATLEDATIAADGALVAAEPARKTGGRKFIQAQAEAWRQHQARLAREDDELVAAVVTIIESGVLSKWELLRAA